MSASHYAGSQLAGGIHFLCVIRSQFLACEYIVGGSDLLAGGTFFFVKYKGPSGGSQMSSGGIIILHIIRRHFLVCGRGPNCQPLHVQSTSDACRLLTTLTRPRREHQGGGRRRGLGRERHGGREDLAVVSHAEGSTTVRGFTGSPAVAGE